MYYYPPYFSSQHVQRLELHTEDRLVYQFYPIQTNVLNFKVKAPNDAHIALTTAPHESRPMYEVFFGGWENTKSVIRRDQAKPDVVEVQTPRILDPNNFRGFWIRWDNNTISAGVEGDFSPILRHYDPALFPIQYFGICTGWGARGHWIIEGAPPSAPIGFNAPTNAPRWLPASAGSVPPNAVVGGNDCNGEPIYVVRAHHEGALIPGKLVPSHGVAYVAWGGRENPKHDYEVLCDCSARWVPAGNGQIPPNALTGGRSEDGETLYVGRAFQDGSTTVGKVQPSHGVCYIPFGGNEVAHKQYEILLG